MSVIKIYDLKTIDDVKQSYERSLSMQESRKYDQYTIDDIMLIRTTNIFPSRREITPLSNSTFIAKSGMNFIHSAFYYELDNEVLKQLETYELYYRSTIHFTENGLVSSHMYGNFDNRPFIILEPLKHQIGKANIRNFAGQDTFIKGNVVLSQDAYIIVKEEEYENLKVTYPEIENYNVILYTGIPKEEKEKYLKENNNSMAEFDINDERAIVETVLMDLGYVPELIGTHYIINSPTSDKIIKINSMLGEQYNVLSNEKHNYSEEYQNDYKNNLLISDIFNKLLLSFICSCHNLNISELLDEEKITNQTAYKLVDIIGLDEVILDINNFNETILKMQELNYLPTSEELLNNNIPDIYEAYIKLMVNQKSEGRQLS